MCQESYYHLFQLVAKKKLIVLLEFFTIKCGGNRRVCACTGTAVDRRNPSAGRCWCSYQAGMSVRGPVTTDWWAELWHGRAGLETPLCSFCVVLLTALYCYCRDSRAVILIHKLSCCHQKGIIAPLHWLWSGCVDTNFQTASLQSYSLLWRG